MVMLVCTLYGDIGVCTLYGDVGVCTLYGDVGVYTLYGDVGVCHNNELFNQTRHFHGLL